MDRNSAIFLTALRGLRNTLASAVDQIDVVLDAADRSIAPVARPQKRARGECPHPVATRIPKSAMGHPHRFHCPVCGEDIEE